MQVQLELNLDNKTSEEMTLQLMNGKLLEMSDSMGKVRRKLFSEMGEMKKLFSELKIENEFLKESLSELKSKKLNFAGAPMFFRTLNTERMFEMA